MTLISKSLMWVMMVQHKTSDQYQTSGKVKKISNDQELIQSDPISCPQNQKGNN